MTKKFSILFLLITTLSIFTIPGYSQSKERESFFPVTKETLFYKKLEGNKVQCKLCPRKCILSEGQTGFCRARKNIKGKLYSKVYGKIVSAHLDPIEKKPLFHFFTFSQGSFNCNCWL